MAHITTITAIVVVRNGERFLAEALQSLAQQFRPPDEILVIDDQSTDRTAQLAQAFPGVRYLLQPDLGIANARNLALRQASGEFVAFLDADDLWTPNKLQVQLAAMQAQPHLMYTTTQLRLFYDPGCPPRPGFREEGFAQGIEGRFPGTMLARREVFDRVGLFDPAFAVAFEVDWFARAQDMQVPSDVVEEVLLHKRIHEANNAIQREQFRREWFVVMRQSLLRKRRQSSGSTDIGTP
ncbi:glycosyltransferase family 2 protein [Candidatus Chloroploca sp. M-50]|uniref:Glycosyltransferase family 2 protein n=1 Tax=Candidatus Chloroploca mongolica TaxID=2528176 RepID=A0ABS4D442_9CHLR|nr:glycosyltransferase family A protein [Candidatus Chloroploca mongolica]MBP1464207.1 glycosyltransferase family 2 protein [Candidatus Chloroploca mongolica]